MTARANLVARGLRTRRDISPAFRRSDLVKRLSARRRRFERIAEAWMACGSLERASEAYTHAQHVTGRADRLISLDWTERTAA